MNKDLKKVIIYTDGACSGNPGPGGWGSVLIYNDNKKIMSGFCPNTTNNRMEITAVIEGLKALKEKCDVNVFTDSSYVLNTFEKGWIYGWLKNGWKTSSRKPVENRDLWEILLQLVNIHKVKFNKVKGHADDELNNLCDKLATDSIKNHF